MTFVPRVHWTRTQNPQSLPEGCKAAHDEGCFYVNGSYFRVCLTSKRTHFVKWPIFVRKLQRFFKILKALYLFCQLFVYISLSGNCLDVSCLSTLKAVQFVVIFTLFTLFSCLFAFLIFISYLFTYFSCLFTFCKLFVYIFFFENYWHFSCLFISLLTSFVCLHISAVCLHFFSQLFVHIILFTWTIFRFLNHWLYKVVHLFFYHVPKSVEASIKESHEA